MEQTHNAERDDAGPSGLPMSLSEYSRYGRQMILPSFGLPGQLGLRSARVLVVGAGGLGCPSIQYLAAAGVGYITVVDHDVVEASNLARQILHTEARIGMSKVLSIKQAVQEINPNVFINALHQLFSTHNAVELLQAHDVALDCTDNALTRYLISDAAVRTGRQVVSGAAQGVDGQLITLHRDLTPGSACSGLSSTSSPSSRQTSRGPCYRCLFPKAPRPDSVTNCEDGGVLGTITGLVGTMQAFETIKLLLGMGSVQGDAESVSPTSMTLVAPFSFPPFKTIRLRPRQIKTCRACGDPQQMDPTAAEARLATDLCEEDYMSFCGLSTDPSTTNDTVVEHISAVNLAQRINEPFILDVRPEVEYEIAKLSKSSNTPIRTIDLDPASAYVALHQQIGTRSDKSVYVVCRRGNDSIIACNALNAAARQHQSTTPLRFINVTGGLRAWSKDLDRNFPVY